MAKKLTILDIAKLAGVGKSTVSRVLTNDPKVKPSTREKVQQVIQDAGFVPSKSAQAMRGGSAKVVGVILSRLDSPSENKAVSGILDVIYAAGYDAVIMESQFCPVKTNEHLQVLRKRNVDGVIVFGFTDFDVKAVAEWQHKAVVIAVETDVVSSVGYDNTGVIQLAMDKLLAQDLRHISFVGVDPSDKTTGAMRLKAYQTCCEQADIKAVYGCGELSHDSGYQLTDKVLKKKTQAIVCASDSLALGVAKRLQELGRNDVIVSGVGASDLLSFIFPNTFSIDPGYFDAGKTSAELLIKQLAGQDSITHLTQTACLT
ncbi:trehalose operon repressor [Photobacterium jeanii]|uniref:Trehalose operon repressor n=1 Tax=Photobacterium jeanii TaxID=858640 RepID=A0A178K8M7_9GAMM|nr:trehalose operon repressor TreR [Photobacterium jeanii]OAN13699.1 trehalose operon repressor [Photobacterium jeanii]PST88820.1 trehalose operon repressor [Photobacterium jeanii]